MENVIKWSVISIVFYFMVFFSSFISLFLGALSGWIAGLVFEETILTFFSLLGIEDMKMWQLGATLGWLGSFFRPAVTSVKD